TIRDVAGVLLEESGRAVAVRRAHAAAVLDLLRGKGSSDPDRVDAELGNVRAGLRWAIEHEPALVDTATVEAFVAYCVARSGFRELYRTLAALAQTAPDAEARAHALRGAGIGANESGDHESAIDLAQRADALFEKLDNTAGQCAALTLAGNAYKAL